MLWYCCRAELCGSSYLQISTLVSLEWDGHQMEPEILMIWGVKTTFTKRQETWDLEVSYAWIKPQNKLNTCATKQRETKWCALVLDVGTSIFPENPLVFQQLSVRKFYLPPKSFLELLPNPILLQSPACWTRIKHKLPTWPTLNSESISGVNLVSSSLSWKSKCWSRLADKDFDICHQKIGHSLQNYFICNEGILCHQN